MKFAQLKGKILTEIKVSDDKDTIEFISNDGSRYALFHMQDCCESVTIDDINGNLKDLIGKPILISQERTSHKDPKIEDDYKPDSFTWTFYHLATIKGFVDIKWFGSSNGYYSESVTFMKLKPEGNGYETNYKFK